MLVIGEKINASNSSVGEAIARRDGDFIANLARAQAEAGAAFIDVNAGGGKGSGHSEIEAMEWLVDTVQAATDRPLTVDSESPDVIAAALGRYRGEKVMINSVTADRSRLEGIGPLAARHRAGLVALAMDESGLPETVAERLDACESIMTHLMGLGIAAEQVFFDPLVLPVSVDSGQGLVTLQTLAQIKRRYPSARTVMGLSNISYGLPRRKIVNRGFLLMAAYAGLDAAILDPLDARMMSQIRVADLLTGRDSYCRGYIRAHRNNTLVD